ncbi:unnamed protein product [Amoebophrya sp. A120]|nr:unnamed protein product [Amoebophrya sp. A120]|eukprot:GSA120T00015817001.1
MTKIKMGSPAPAAALLPGTTTPRTLFAGSWGLKSCFSTGVLLSLVLPFRAVLPALSAGVGGGPLVHMEDHDVGEDAAALGPLVPRDDGGRARGRGHLEQDRAVDGEEDVDMEAAEDWEQLGEQEEEEVRQPNAAEIEQIQPILAQFNEDQQPYDRLQQEEVRQRPNAAELEEIQRDMAEFDGPQGGPRPEAIENDFEQIRDNHRREFGAYLQREFAERDAVLQAEAEAARLLEAQDRKAKFSSVLELMALGASSSRRAGLTTTTPRARNYRKKKSRTRTPRRERGSGSSSRSSSTSTSSSSSSQEHQNHPAARAEADVEVVIRLSNALTGELFVPGRGGRGHDHIDVSTASTCASASSSSSATGGGPLRTAKKSHGHFHFSTSVESMTEAKNFVTDLQLEMNFPHIRFILQKPAPKKVLNSNAGVVGRPGPQAAHHAEDHAGVHLAGTRMMTSDTFDTFEDFQKLLIRISEVNEHSDKARQIQNLREWTTLVEDEVKSQLPTTTSQVDNSGSSSDGTKDDEPTGMRHQPMNIGKNKKKQYRILDVQFYKLHSAPVKYQLQVGLGDGIIEVPSDNTVADVIAGKGMQTSLSSAAANGAGTVLPHMRVFPKDPSILEQTVPGLQYLTGTRTTPDRAFSTGAATSQSGLAARAKSFLAKPRILPFLCSKPVFLGQMVYQRFNWFKLFGVNEQCEAFLERAEQALLEMNFFLAVQSGAIMFMNGEVERGEWSWNMWSELFFTIKK